jgi:hypothetical protein
MISRLEQRRDDIGIDRQRAGPDPLKDSLDSMGELGDRREPNHGRGSLQAVRRPEGFVEMRAVALTPLKVHQSLFETDQKLACFLVKHLPESVVRTAAQIRCPSPER